IALMPQARHPVLFYWWFEFSVGRVLKQAKPDLFYSPDGFLSLRADTPSISVMHDLNYEYYPEDLPKMAAWYYKHYFPKFMAKANQILTVSEFSKQDIIKTYGVNPAKIDVVYNGADEAYRKLSEEEKVAVKQKYSNGKDFFVYVSALHPRKNVKRLLEAFDKMKESTSSDIKLLLVGPTYFKNSEMMSVYEQMKHKQDVIFTGRLEVDELCKVVGAAFAMAYVSYFEGFGIPIVEAMQCEIPVITSNVTSMPEVAGTAALLVDPFSIDSIADAMIKLYKDNAVRQDLIEKARLRKNVFTWDRTADLTWNAIEKTLAQCR
ncbi:MAG TPA: glycosyltransferase family 1 protein, partial [Bacteroidia bacterium]|nr:glycosyltransferase family 1 protein [Bacteroidia bacterium]